MKADGGMFSVFVQSGKGKVKVIDVGGVLNKG